MRTPRDGTLAVYTLPRNAALAWVRRLQADRTLWSNPSSLAIAKRIENVTLTSHIVTSVWRTDARVNPRSFAIQYVFFMTYVRTVSL